MRGWPNTRLREHKPAIATIVALLLLLLIAAPASANPIVISEVSSENITDTTATITWTTDVPGNSTVNYGNSTPLDSTASNSDFLNNHIIELSGLTSATLYYYEVISTNEAGNETHIDDNGGAYYKFNTEPYPPEISNINESDITDVSATITWMTDRLADSTVNYGNSTALGSTVPDSNYTYNHTLYLVGLAQNTQYYYEVSSTNQYGNNTVADNYGAFYTFTTGLGAPTISGVSASNITDVSATIAWVTDIQADSTVNYGNSTELGSSVSIGNLTYNHTMNLTGLTQNTLYYYEVSSTNAEERTSVSPGNNTYYTFTTAVHLELEGWGWCTNYGSVATATLEGYATVVERTLASQSFSVHAIGNLTLQLADAPAEIVPVDLHGSRIRSLFYLRQEVTGLSSTFTGTWITGNDTQFYMVTSGLLALPNPGGESFKTARLCFVLLRTPDTEVPVIEPGGFAADLESIIAWFTKYDDKVLDSLVGTGVGKLIGDILAKIMILIAQIRALGTPYFP